MFEDYYNCFKESKKIQYYVKKRDTQISSKKFVSKECPSNLDNSFFYLGDGKD